MSVDGENLDGNAPHVLRDMKDWTQRWVDWANENLRGSFVLDEPHAGDIVREVRLSDGVLVLSICPRDGHEDQAESST